MIHRSSAGAAIRLYALIAGTTAILVVNDHLLKAAWPGPVSGKLSDVAGLILVPALALAAASAFVGVREHRAQGMVAIGSAGATAICFAAVKTWEPMTDLYRVVVGMLQWPPRAIIELVTRAEIPQPAEVQLVADGTDLIALPAVLVPLLLLRGRWLNGWPLREMTRRRLRVGAAAALVLASFALMATSPPMEPVQTVAGMAEGQRVLSAETPVAAFDLKLEATDEALWSDDPAVRIDTAILTVTLIAQWQGPAPADGGAAPDSVRLTLVDREGNRVPNDPLRQDLATVNLLEGCEELRDCALGFEVVVQWVDPAPGAAVTAGVRVNAESQITGPESAPLDAAITVDLGAPVALDLPALEGTATEEAVLLSAERPMVSRHIVVRASAGAWPADPEWPLDPSGVLVTSVESPEPTGEPLHPPDIPVTVSLIPDEPIEGDEAIIRLRGSQRVAIHPFADCQAGEPCERGYTLVLAWFSDDPEQAALVDWQLSAGILYHDDSQPTDDASVEVVIDGRANVTAAGERLTATLEGEMILSGEETGVASQEETHLEVRISAEALEAEALGGPVPAVFGTLSLQAVANRSFGDEPMTIAFALDPYPVFDGQHFAAADPVVGGPPVEIPIFPAPDCVAGAPCAARIELSAEVQWGERDRIRPTDRFQLHWSATVELIYPDGSDIPPGAELRLVHVAP